MDFKLRFATYWSLVGVPPEQEAEAVELLFDWVRSAAVDITTKWRAIKALLELAEKFPELQNELRLSLESIADAHTDDFGRKVRGVLLKL